MPRVRHGISWAQLQQCFRDLSPQPDLSKSQRRDLLASAAGTATKLERDKQSQLRGWGCSASLKLDSSQEHL